MTTKASKPSFLKLVSYFFRPYPFYLLVIVAVSIGFILLEALSTAVVYPMIDSFLRNPASLEHNPISAKLNVLFDWMSSSINTPLSFLILFLLLSIFTNILNYCRITISDVFSRIVTRDFQAKVYKKYLYSDYQYFLDNKQGTIIFRTITAPAYAAVMYSSLIKITVNLLKFTAILILLFVISFKVTLFMTVLAVVFYWIIGFISKRIVYRNACKIQTTYEEQNVIANEFVNGIRQIKIGQSQGDWFEVFAQQTKQLSKYYIKNDIFRAIPTTGLQIFVVFAVLALVLICRRQLAVRLTDYLPLFGVYFFAFMRLAPSLTEIASMRIILEERLPYAEAIYDELHSDSDSIKDGSIVIDTFEKGIRFDKVFFTYPGREYTLRDINFTIEKGKTTALVGLSGSGKSTLVDLLIRLFDVEAGRIMIDNYELKDLNLSSWLNKIGYVSQDTFIFNASIQDNIAFRAKGVSFEMVKKAADIANIHDFIMELPQQYNTIVGDRGLKLSGGQRQRIAIAQAVLRNPEILIFDEATSSLDSLSESQVQNAIKKISQNRTVILIAHRLSTVVNADKIIVFKDGRVVEEGCHKNLVEKNGVYHCLYKSSL